MDIKNVKHNFTFNGVNLQAYKLRPFMGGYMYQISWEDGSPMTTTSGDGHLPIERVVEDWKLNGY